MSNKTAFALIYTPYTKKRQYSPKNSLASNNFSNYLALVKKSLWNKHLHSSMPHTPRNGITHQRTRWRRIIFQTTWHLLRRHSTIMIWHCPTPHKRSNANTGHKTPWRRDLWPLIENKGIIIPNSLMPKASMSWRRM